MATIVPTGVCSAGYHSKLIGIVPAAGSARSNGTRSVPHQAPSTSSHGSRRSRPTASWSSSVSWATALAGARLTAVIAASSRAGTNRDRRWRIRDDGQMLNDGSILRSAEVAGDAAVPGPGHANLVTFASLEVEPDLEGAGVARQVEPDAGGHGRLGPLDPVGGAPARPGQPGLVQRDPDRPLVALDQHRPVRQLRPPAVVDLGLGPAPQHVPHHPPAVGGSSLPSGGL